MKTYFHAVYSCVSVYHACMHAHAYMGFTVSHHACGGWRTFHAIWLHMAGWLWHIHMAATHTTKTYFHAAYYGVLRHTHFQPSSMSNIFFNTWGQYIVRIGVDDTWVCHTCDENLFSCRILWCSETHICPTYAHVQRMLKIYSVKIGFRSLPTYPINSHGWLWHMHWKPIIFALRIFWWRKANNTIW
jgi:hypothetical protein